MCDEPKSDNVGRKALESLATTERDCSREIVDSVPRVRHSLVCHEQRNEATSEIEYER